MPLIRLKRIIVFVLQCTPPKWAAFVSAYNKLVTEKKEIIANAEIIRRTLCNTDALQEEK